MRFFILLSIGIAILLCLAINSASAQDRPAPLRRPERPERDTGEMREPEMGRKIQERMEKTRREIENLRRKAGMAKKHGQKEELEKLTHEIRRLEETLHELERQAHSLRPDGPRPERPHMDPEQAEEMRRNIERLEREIEKARERGDEKRARELMREIEEIKRNWHRPEEHPEPEFTEEDIARVLEWLEKNEPETLEKLERLRDREPDAYYHFLRELFGKMEHMEKMKEHDPEGYARMNEMHKLDRKIWELVKKQKESKTKEESEKIISQLKEALSRLFDLKQAQHKAEIEDLEKEVAKLKEFYQKNQDHKKEIIEERLKELSGKKRSFDW